MQYSTLVSFGEDACIYTAELGGAVERLTDGSSSCTEPGLPPAPEEEQRLADAAPAGHPEVPGPSPDLRAPGLGVRVVGGARRRRSVRVRIRCDEPCRLRVVSRLSIGRRKLRLREARGSAAPGTVKVLRLRLSRRGRRALRRALARRRRVRLRVIVRARDGADNLSRRSVLSPGRLRRLPPAADTLRRTPLYDRHERAGAKLVPFAGWEMPVQYEGIRQEHMAVRMGCGVFDVSHGGDRDERAAGGGVPPARALQRRHEGRRARRPVLRALPRGRRRARRSLHLPARGPLPHGHERSQPREGPGLVPGAGRGSMWRCATPSLERAMLAVQGPEARRIVGELADGELRPGCGPPTSAWRASTASSAAPATRARTASRS